MATQHIDTLIIGAGQAGLATGYHLKRLGREVDARWAWSMTCTGPGAAYERRDWLSAYRTLSDLDESALTAGDYAALATTAYLLGRHNDCVQAFQRAYQVNAEQGGQLAAARSALWLAMVLFEGGEAAIAGGWMERARRLLDQVEGDVVERGYLHQLLSYGHLVKGEFALAAASVAQVTHYGQLFHARTCWPSGCPSRVGSRSTPGGWPTGCGCSTRRWSRCSPMRSRPCSPGWSTVRRSKPARRSRTLAGPTNGRTP
jgi:hypothetical protein